MKEYWLLLESYVFIWKDESNVLVYNTFSAKGEVFKATSEISTIVSNLQDENNLYCISITDVELGNSSVKDFVESLRRSFSGDLIDKSLFPQKPVVVIPESNIADKLSREQELSYNPHVFGENILKNLTDITIMLTGICECNCKRCHHNYKQTLCCYRNEHVLSIEKIETILNRISYSSVFDINFIGGNIFSYPFFKDLLSLLSKYHFRKSFYINYCSLTNSVQEKILSLGAIPYSHLKIIVDCSEVQIENFEPQSTCLDVDVEYVFLVSDVKTYERCMQKIEKNGIKNRIIPIYTEENIDFFYNYIYLNKEDILSTPWKKHQIFSNQNVNTNDFGKLLVESNGEIYTNVHYAPVGKWDDEIKELVYNQLKEESPWLRTRSKSSPCNECLFCDICPPPSNYELVIGKSNLCHIKP